jgi:F1F0 ATPase subunit 2
MISPLAFALVFLGGFGLGLLFFGGLWATVRAIPTSRHPALLTLASFWGRTAVVIAGLLLVMDGLWQRALAGLVGFVCARVAISQWVPRNHKNPKPLG